MTCYTGLGRRVYRRNMNDLALSVVFKDLDISKEFIGTTKHVRILSSAKHYQSRFPVPASFLTYPEEIVTYAYQYLADLNKEKEEHNMAIMYYELLINTRLLLTSPDVSPLFDCIFGFVFSTLLSRCTQSPKEIAEIFISGKKKVDNYSRLQINTIINTFFKEPGRIISSISS
ncbi:unnamed protein product [Rotaria sp. Silwood2]|nr:unnamed protein product [Rotaria sp. Silwood2]